MAVLKQRLHMKTATGYDVVHMETSSDLVQRDNGTNVEDTLNTLTTNVANLSTSVENVTNNITPDAIGALPATGTAASATKLETARTFQVNLGSTSSVSFDGTSNVTPGVTGTLGVSNGGTGKTTEPLGLYNLINGCNSITSDDIVDTDTVAIGDVSAATAKSITVEELKNVFGSGSNGPTASITDIPTTAGNTCTWGGYNWTVVHVTDTLIYMILTNIYRTVVFGGTSYYAGSTIAALCDTFLKTMDTEYQNTLADVTVESVTAKVFIPSSSQANGGFSWFSSAAHRIAYYSSTATNWWLSTTVSSSSVYYVNTGGVVAYSSNGTISVTSSVLGFRPCVAVIR